MTGIRVKHYGRDLDCHRCAVVAMDLGRLRETVEALGGRTLRCKWDRLRLEAAREELGRRGSGEFEDSGSRTVGSRKTGNPVGGMSGEEGRVLAVGGGKRGFDEHAGAVGEGDVEAERERVMKGKGGVR